MHNTTRRIAFSHSVHFKSNRVLDETINIVRGSNTCCRRSSVSASSAVVASDDVSTKAPKKGGKRVSREERKSLLESFVNNYRAMNSGKFPTATEAQKEVGGGFYLTRKIIQEIEYETRMSSTSLSGQSLEKEVNLKKEQLKVVHAREKVKQPEAQVPLVGQEILGTELPLNDVSRVTILEEKEGVKKTSSSSEKDPVSEDRMIIEEIERSTQTSGFNDVPSVEAGEKHTEGVKKTSSSSEKDPVSEDRMIIEEIERSTQTSGFNDVPSVNAGEKHTEGVKKTSSSSEKDPVSEDRMIIEEIERTTQTSGSNDVPSVDTGEKRTEGDASVLDHKNFSYKNVMSLAAGDKDDVISQKTDLSNEEPKVVPLAPVISEDRKEKTTAIDDHQLESSKTEEPARDIPREHSDIVESPKKSFAWNLKSLADGIVNFWRKL